MEKTIKLDLDVFAKLSIKKSELVVANGGYNVSYSDVVKGMLNGN